MAGVVSNGLSINPHPGYGRAAALLFLIDRPTVTIIPTFRCRLTCADCFAPKQMRPRDLDPELVKGAVEELRGLTNLYYSGGEPFRYLRNTQEFMDLLHYSAERVKRVYIDTSGEAFPRDQAGVRSFISEFPSNTTIVLSIDTFHGDALIKVGVSMAALFKMTQEEAISRGLGFEVNIRMPSDKDPRVELERYGISPDSLTALFNQQLIHLNSICAQNAGENLPASETIATKVSDYVDHMFEVEPVGIFINPQGLIIRDIHSAFMLSPAKDSIIGNLHHQTISQALSEGLVKGYYGDRDILRGGKTERQVSEGIANRTIPIEAESFAEVNNVLFAKTDRHINWDKLFSKIKDPKSGVTWEFDLDPKKMVEAFGPDIIPAFLGQSAALFVEAVVSPENNGRQVLIRKTNFFKPAFTLIVKNGKPSVRSNIEATTPDKFFNGILEDTRMSLASFTNSLEKLFGERAVNQYFLRYVADGLERHREKAGINKAIFYYYKAAQEFIRNSS